MNIRRIGRIESAKIREQNIHRFSDQISRTTIRVGAVQMNSMFGRVDENLEKASKFVVQAAQKNAQLVVFPELMPSGYGYGPVMWKFGEKRGGKTETWLKEVSKKHNIAVGTSYVDCDEDHFYNTFMIIFPNGDTMRVRKKRNMNQDAFTFRNGNTRFCVATPLGRIAIGLNTDSLYPHFFDELVAESPDFVILSYAVPLPHSGVSNSSLNWLENAYSEIPRMMGAYYKLPFVCASAVGKFVSTPNKIPLHLNYTDAKFVEGSAIYDHTGKEVATIERKGEEDVIVSNIEVPILPYDKCFRNLFIPIPSRDEVAPGAVHLPPSDLRALSLLYKGLGSIYYWSNQQRKIIAHAINFPRYTRYLQAHHGSVAHR